MAQGSGARSGASNYSPSRRNTEGLREQVREALRFESFLATIPGTILQASTHLCGHPYDPIKLSLSRLQAFKALTLDQLCGALACAFILAP